MQKPGNKLSIIFMDDTGKTSRFRCKKWLIIAFYIIIAILPIITGLACWFGYESWQAMQLWKQEKAQFEQALNKSKIRIQSLEHLQTLLKSNLQPAFVKQKALPVPKEATPIEPATLETASAEPVTPRQPSQDKIDLSIYKKPLDDKRIRLDNVQAHSIDKDKIRIKLDIFNAESSRVLAGTIAFSILLPNGDKQPLEVKDSSFRIRRYKRIINTTIVDEAILQDISNSLIVAEVYINNKLSYRNYYPIKTQ